MNKLLNGSLSICPYSTHSMSTHFLCKTTFYKMGLETGSETTDWEGRQSAPESPGNDSTGLLHPHTNMAGAGNACIPQYQVSRQCGEPPSPLLMALQVNREGESRGPPIIRCFPSICSQINKETAPPIITLLTFMVVTEINSIKDISLSFLMHQKGQPSHFCEGNQEARPQR